MNKVQVIAKLVAGGHEDLADRLLQVVAERHKTEKIGPFDVRWYPKYENFMPDVRKNLQYSNQMFRKAGLKLRGPIKIEIMGAGWKKRSYYSQGVIRILPENMRDSKSLSLFVHEIAHYIHDRMLPSGFGNGDMWQKFTSVRDSNQDVKPDVAWSDDVAKPTSLDDPKLLAWIKSQNQTEVLEDMGKTLTKVRDNLARGLKKGQIVDWTDSAHPFDRSMGQHDFKGKVVRNNQKGIILEIMNPSEWWADNPMTTIQRHVAITKIKQLKEEGERIKLALHTVYERQNELSVMQTRDQSQKYDKFVAEWFPTTYSKKNVMEWFAELLTAYVIKPSNFSKPVKEYLVGLIKQAK